VSDAAPASPRLPRAVRIAAILCLLSAAATGLPSASEAMALTRFEELREATLKLEPAPWFGDPALARKALEARFFALESMRDARILTLGLLSLACAFTGVAAARILRPGGLPREGMRKLLSAAAIATAVLRTVDGAQWAVVARRMGEAMARGLTLQPPVRTAEELAQVKEALPGIMLGGTGLWTFLIVGLFMGLSQYFRSAHVRALLGSPPPRSTRELR